VGSERDAVMKRCSCGYLPLPDATRCPKCGAVVVRESAGFHDGPSAASTLLRDQDLLRVVHDLRKRASALTESFAPSTPERPARLVMLGDAGVMEWAASVIEGAINDAK
jgi:hypothetical protein